MANLNQNGVVDTRVVSMEFDNSRFERNISKTIDSVDKLSKQLNKVEKNDYNFEPLQQGLDRSANKMSAFETIAMGALLNVGRRVEECTMKVVQFFNQFTSINEAVQGWSKMEEQVKSTKTLLAQGFDLDDVNTQLGELQWFADETSYSLTDMTSNITKFTGAGASLRDSTIAMEGIATMTALAGQNATTASRAMYQISQAMGMGYMGYQDYKSLLNYNIATTEFKEKTVEAAIAVGTLKKNADGTYETIEKGLTTGGKTFENINSLFASGYDGGLMYKWFSNDVLLKVFKEYGSAIEDVYKYSEENSVSASKAIQALDGSLNEFGLKAFLAAQEARSFSDAVTATHDAVQSSWSKTFSIIFGDAEEQTELWTNIANSLYDIFVEPHNLFNSMLKEYNSDGRLKTLMSSISKIASQIGDIFSIDYEAMYNKLFEVIDNVVEKIIAFSDNMEGSRATKFLQNIYQIINNIYLFARQIMDLTASIRHSVTSKIKTELYNISNYIVDILQNIIQFVDANENIIGILTLVQNIFINLNVIFKNICKLLVGTIVPYIQPLVNLLTTVLYNALAYIRNITLYLSNNEFITSLQSTISSIIEIIYNVFNKIKDFLSASGSFLSPIINFIKTFAEQAWSILKELFIGIFNTAKDYINPFTVLIGGVTLALSKMVGSTSGALKVVGKLFSKETFEASGLNKILNIISVFTGKTGHANVSSFALTISSISNSISAFASICTPANILSIAAMAGSFALLVNALTKFASLDVQQIVVSMTALTIMYKQVLKSFSKLDMFSNGASNVVENITNKKKGIFGFLSSIGKSIGSIFTPIKGAFTQIKTFIKQFSTLIMLMAYTKSIKNLMSSLEYLKDLDFAQISLGIVGTRMVMDRLVQSISSIASIEYAKAFKTIPTVLVLLSFAQSVKTLISSLKYFKDTKTDDIVKGIASISIIMIGLSRAMQSMSKVTVGGLGNAAAMLGFAESIKILLSTIKNLNEYSFTELLKTLSALSLFMVAFAGTMNIIAKGFSNVGLLKSIGGSLLQLTTSGGIVMIMLAVKNLIKQMAQIPTENLSEITASIGGLLAIIGIFQTLIPVVSRINADSFPKLNSIFMNISNLFTTGGLTVLLLMSNEIIKTLGSMKDPGSVTQAFIPAVIAVTTLYIALLEAANLMAQRMAEVKVSQLAKFAVLSGTLVSFISGLALVLDKLSRISGIDISVIVSFGSILAAMSVAIAILPKVLESFSSAKWLDIAKFTVLIGSLSGFLVAFGKMAKGLVGVEWSSLLSAAVAMASFIAAMSLVFKLISSTALGIGGLVAGSMFLGALSLSLSSVKSFAEGISMVGDIIMRLGSADKDQIKSGLETTKAIIHTFTSFGLEGILAGVGASGMKKFVEASKDIEATVVAFNKVPKGSEDKIKSVLSAIGQGLAGMTWGAFGGATSFAKIAEPMNAMATGIKKLADASNDIEDPTKLFTMLNSLASSVKSFTFAGWGADAVSKLDNLDKLAEGLSALSRTTVRSTKIQEVSNALTILSQGVSSFTFSGWGAESMATIAEPLTALANGIMEFTKISNIKELTDNVRESLYNISRGVKSFIFAGWGASDVTKVTDTIQPLVESINNIAKANLDDASSKSDQLKTLMTGLVEAIRGKGLFEADWSKSLSKVGEFFGGLANLLNALSNDLNGIDDTIIEKVKSVMTSIKTLLSDADIRFDKAEQQQMSDLQYFVGSFSEMFTQMKSIYESSDFSTNTENSPFTMLKDLFVSINQNGGNELAQNVFSVSGALTELSSSLLSLSKEKDSINVLSNIIQLFQSLNGFGMSEDMNAVGINEILDKLDYSKISTFLSSIDSSDLEDVQIKLNTISSVYQYLSDTFTNIASVYESVGSLSADKISITNLLNEYVLAVANWYSENSLVIDELSSSYGVIDGANTARDVLDVCKQISELLSGSNIAKSGSMTELLQNTVGEAISWLGGNWSEDFVEVAEQVYTFMTELSKTINDSAEKVSEKINVLPIIDKLIAQLGAQIGSDGRLITDVAESIVVSVADAISTSTDSNLNNVYLSAKYLIDGYTNGIGDGYSTVFTKAKLIGAAAVAGIMAGQESHSPSKATERAGVFFGEGYIAGMNKTEKSVTSRGRELGLSSTQAIKEALYTNYGSMYNDLFDMTPTVSLKFDTSGAEQAVSDVNKAFGNNSYSYALAGDASSMFSQMKASRNQNGVIDAINGLGNRLDQPTTNNYSINGLTYSDDSNVSSAISNLVSTMKVNRRF